MLFVTLGTPKASSTRRSRIRRRLDWKEPKGMRTVGEYWLQSDDPALVMIVEADSIAPMLAATAEWDDEFVFRIFPAVSVEEGLEIGRQMMAMASA